MKSDQNKTSIACCSAKERDNENRRVQYSCRNRTTQSNPTTQPVRTLRFLTRGPNTPHTTYPTSHTSPTNLPAHPSQNKPCQPIPKNPCSTQQQQQQQQAVATVTAAAAQARQCIFISRSARISWCSVV